jgi:DNA polymerase beta
LYVSNTDRSPNQGIIDLLRRDKETEEKNPAKNPFKIAAFSKAIKAISNIEHPIRSGSGVMGVSFIYNHIETYGFSISTSFQG